MAEQQQQQQAGQNTRPPSLNMSATTSERPAHYLAIIRYTGSLETSIQELAEPLELVPQGISRARLENTSLRTISALFSSYLGEAVQHSSRIHVGMITKCVFHGTLSPGILPFLSLGTANQLEHAKMASIGDWPYYFSNVSHGFGMHPSLLVLRTERPRLWKG
ncbi:hypothetical protein E2C01_020614 [Portunus trituberculatus]|uniref:Uncharacterized protein n=1 Tax=Portunus trituberculatus TaxID=210409 RepID=A0A5B7E204_PORTR|nr:hypothetical protein [Portunus trituberculatus]